MPCEMFLSVRFISLTSPHFGAEEEHAIINKLVDDEKRRREVMELNKNEQAVKVANSATGLWPLSVLMVSLSLSVLMVRRDVDLDLCVCCRPPEYRHTEIILHSELLGIKTAECKKLQDANDALVRIWLCVLVPFQREERAWS